MNEKLVKVKDEKQLIALIIPKSCKHQSNNFITETGLPFQVGLNSYPQNHQVKKHKHRPTHKVIKKTQEFVYLKSGKVKVNFYNEQGKPLTTHILKKGDALLQVAGGHEFKFLETTKAIVIKQGPYKGTSQDKEFLKTATP